MSLVWLKTLLLRRPPASPYLPTSHPPSPPPTPPHHLCKSLSDDRPPAALDMDADADAQQQQQQHATEHTRLLPHASLVPPRAYDPESCSTSSSSSAHRAKRAWWRVDARVISDATIGLSDGLTVPFALTAGLSALGDTRVVIYGGLAELIAGAISMGLGGYLGAKSEL